MSRGYNSVSGRRSVRRTGPDAELYALLYFHRSVFLARYYLEDPANPGFVLRFYDLRNRLHYLQQTNPALQVAVPTAHADYNGDLCVNFTGVERYQSNLDPVHWGYLSNGSGMSFASVTTTVDPAGTPVWWSTGFSGTKEAFFMYAQTVTAVRSARVAVYRTTAPSTVFLANVGAMPTSTPVIVQADHGTGSSPQWRSKVTGQSEVVGSNGQTPENGAPESTLTLGASGNGANPMTGRWWGGFFSRRLNAPERAERDAYILKRTSLVA